MGFYAKGDFKRHFDGKNCKKNVISKTISKQKREREDMKEHVDEKYLKLKRPKRIMPTRSVKSFEIKSALKHQANKVHFELKGHDQKYQFHRHVNKKYAKVKSPGRKDVSTKCEETFEDKLQVETHIKTVNLSKNFFKCESCSKFYSSKANLKKHVEQVHLKVKNYYCSKCNMGFYAKWDLKIHVEGIHLKTKATVS